MSEASPWVVDVTEADFEREVIERSKSLPVVVDFWAPWCGPCRALGPVLEKLAQERQGEFLLAKVNTDECQDLAAAFRIESIPAVKALRDGQVVLEFEGLLPEPALREFLDRVCPSESEREARKARDLEGPDPAAAEALYRRVLQGERPPDAARVGLARLLIARGEEAEAAELLRGVSPGGPEAAEVDRLTAVLFLKEQAPRHGHRGGPAAAPGLRTRERRIAPTSWVACWPRPDATRRRWRCCCPRPSATRSWPTPRCAR